MTEDKECCKYDIMIELLRKLNKGAIMKIIVLIFIVVLLILGLVHIHADKIENVLVSTTHKEIKQDDNTR